MVTLTGVRSNEESAWFYFCVFVFFWVDGPWKNHGPFILPKAKGPYKKYLDKQIGLT
jgi:hypothetical protein